MAESVRCRIDFKYALALELDDPGFHHSVLADFRDRLAHNSAATRTSPGGVAVVSQDSSASGLTFQ
ncbi:transposase [Streptomyces sp. NPDC003710]